VIKKGSKGGEADASEEASAAAAPAADDAAAEAAADDSQASRDEYRKMFAEGDLAVLRALVSKPELNWQKVVVGAWLPERGRFEVKLSEGAPRASTNPTQAARRSHAERCAAGRAGGATICVKPGNLLPHVTA